MTRHRCPLLTTAGLTNHSSFSCVNSTVSDKKNMSFAVLLSLQLLPSLAVSPQTTRIRPDCRVKPKVIRYATMCNFYWKKHRRCTEEEDQSYRLKTPSPDAEQDSAWPPAERWAILLLALQAGSVLLLPELPPVQVAGTLQTVHPGSEEDDDAARHKLGGHPTLTRNRTNCHVKHVGNKMFGSKMKLSGGNGLLV